MATEPFEQVQNILGLGAIIEALLYFVWYSIELIGFLGYIYYCNFIF